MANEPFPITPAGTVDINAATGQYWGEPPQDQSFVGPTGTMGNVSPISTGGVDISGAASATINPDQLALGEKLIQQLRPPQFPGGGMLPGAQLPRPIMPQPPITPDPSGIVPQGPFGSVGERKRADAQAVFSNISNLVKSVRDQQYQKKVETIQRDLEVLGGAVTGYKEGMSTGNQQMIKHNAAIINDMLRDDPKKAKELQKVFDIDLNPLATAKGKGGGKGKINEYTDAGQRYLRDVQTARKENPQLNPQAAYFMQKMPQTLQADPRYQQYLEGLKVGAYPKAGDKMTFYKEMMDIQQKLTKGALDRESKEKLTGMLVDSMEHRISMQQTGALMRVIQQGMDAKERMELLTGAMRYRADQALQGVEGRTRAIENATKGTPQARLIMPMIQVLRNRATQITNDLKAAEKAHDAAKIKDLQGQSEVVKFEMDLVAQRAAQMTGLDPQQFSGEDTRPQQMDEMERKIFDQIFASPEQSTGESADQ